MKRALLAVAVTFALLSSGCDKFKSGIKGAALSLGDFEGEITMNATRTKDPGPMQLVFGIKKPKYRIDASGGAASSNAQMKGGSFIIDPPQKKGYALDPATKKAVVIDFDKAKSARMPGMNTGPGTKANEPPPKVEKTGKKETIAGYECEIWYVTPASGQRSELCMADGITWVDLGDLGWSSPEMTLGAVATGANKFPLRIVSADSKLEATKIEKKLMDKARFEVPPDYQVIDLAAMMQNLPGLAPKK